MYLREDVDFKCCFLVVGVLLIVDDILIVGNGVLNVGNFMCDMTLHGRI